MKTENTWDFIEPSAAQLLIQSAQLANYFRIPVRLSRLLVSELLSYLFLEVVVSEVEDLQSSISPGQSKPLGAAVKRHGSDSSGHVVEEPNTVHLELTHFYYLRKTQIGRLLKPGRREQNTTFKPAVR